MTTPPAWLAAVALEVRCLGDASLLAERPVAIMGSRRCPGALLLASADWAEVWAEKGDARPVLAGGFQTSVEAEVLRRLLRGGAPVVRLPARRLPKRLPSAERAALDAGRLVIASPFSAARPTTALAERRNALLVRIARAALVLHAAPGSRTSAWAEDAVRAGLPLFTLDHPANAPLFDLGARPLTSDIWPLTQH